MASFALTAQSRRNPPMIPIGSRLRAELPLASLRFRSFICSCSLAQGLAEVAVSETQGSGNPAVRKESSGGGGNGRAKVGGRAKVKFNDAQLKQNWIDALSCPTVDDGGDVKVNCGSIGLDWVLGIDPDVSGALAVLKPGESGCTAEVFDSPFLPVVVGKRVRKRLDPKSIIQLIRSLDAPVGTRAYVEQSNPYPGDGKQGWWSGGFGYGLWVGILVTSGFSVIPVSSILWKNGFNLSGSRTTKDDSRLLASKLFPSLCEQLKRKKDHGRAEALLIAAYGKGLKLDLDLPSIPEE